MFIALSASPNEFYINCGFEKITISNSKLRFLRARFSRTSMYAAVLRSVFSLYLSRRLCLKMKKSAFDGGLFMSENLSFNKDCGDETNR